MLKRTALVAVDLLRTYQASMHLNFPVLKCQILTLSAEMEALEDKHMFPEEGMYVTKNKPAEIAALEGKHGELNPQPLPPVYSPSSTPTPHGGVLGQGPDGIGVVRNPITGQPVTEGGLGPQNLPLTVQPEPTLGIANSPLPQLFPHENLDPNDF